MAEGEGTPVPKQRQQARKRSWERGARKRTLRSRLWAKTGFGNKTLWDWMQLFLVPLMLALLGYAFTSVQQDISRQISANEQAQQTALQLELEEKRAQNAAVATYFEAIRELLLDEDPEDARVQLLIQARTLTVLEGIDPSRKTQVLRFLEEANLVQKIDGEDPVIELDSADLAGVKLESPSSSLVLHPGPAQIDLSGADLGLSDLRKAHLLGVNLADANLRGAKLNDANLSFAKLSDVDLREVDLSGADLRGANLSGANLGPPGATAFLVEANLSEASLRNADLRYADLRGASLKGALLSGANLSGANLGGANLKGAILDEADLSNVGGVTKEELAQQPRSLEGATMPNGQKYEDWLKDREGRKEDAENE